MMDLDDRLAAAKWQQEEDDGEDVKDNWDDEDEEAPAIVEQPKKQPIKPKKLVAKANQGADASDKPLSAQELREKRLQEEKLQRESDMKLTKQMLGMEDKDISLEFPLESQDDFDKFHKNLVHKLWCYDKSPHYFLLMERLIRDLCAPLEADELKSLGSTVNALFNEKVKLKAKPKKKGVKGLAVKVERNNLDRNDYADDLDDIM